MTKIATHNSQFADNVCLARLFEISEFVAAVFLRFAWSGLVFLLWFRNAYPRLILPDAGRPFVYRALVPMIARTLAGVIGAPHPIPIMAALTSQLSPDPAYYAEAHWTVIIIFASVLLAWSGVKRLLRNLDARPVMQMLLPPVIIAGAVLFASYGYIYDWPQLALITWTLALLIDDEQSHRLPAVFALACLNKETSLLLVFAVAAYVWPHQPRRLALLVIGQLVAIWAIVHGAVMFLFWDNPGSVVEWHWADHLASYQHDPGLLVIWLVCLGMIALLIGLGWSGKPRLLKCALLPLAPMAAMYFLWGYPTEIRIYLEYWPVIALMALPWREV
jgi:hypothetical protein